MEGLLFFELCVLENMGHLIFRFFSINTVVVVVVMMIIVSSKR
jgi:hypothetical protein